MFNVCTKKHCMWVFLCFDNNCLQASVNPYRGVIVQVLLGHRHMIISQIDDLPSAHVSARLIYIYNFEPPVNVLELW